MKNVNYTLYLVTDKKIMGNRDFYNTIEQALKSGVTLLQVREKNMGSKEFYETALKLKTMCKKYQVPLIINDRLDIALAVDADGLHVGQSDLPIELCKKLFPNKIIGVSANSYNHALKAYEAGADYIGLGAVFPTNSKDDAVVITDDINKIVKEIPIPIVGIGGINENNCGQLMQQGFAGVAVISAILGKQNVAKATKNLLSKLVIS
ncbi:thiamine phosphate synthase [Clostridium sp. 'deep sea']|uniref:thiamine phosphate synthase n=1 Tax=Clostridium sp. 'deep sea' TaxID=2779445 RepID=UPI0018967442|nr:thiamine phosphate synthase [Clostridium sp. 'deep sea']QOR36719.1 thiamine phosphate synthase [Clostridium sp. 'deep sea']